MREITRPDVRDLYAIASHQSYADAEKDFDRWLSNHVAAELDRLADKMLDPVEGLPFDDDYDLAIVAAWVGERAEEMRK